MVDVGHADCFFEAGGGSSGCCFSDFLALLGEDLAVFAHYSCVVEHEAHAFADADRFALDVCLLLDQCVLADELQPGVAGFAFVDCPHEGGLEGGDAGGDVVAVEAEAGLESEGVSAT